MSREEDFARQLDADLEFDFPFGGITLRLREWTEPQYLELVGRIPVDQLRNPTAALPIMVPPAVVGWRGVTFGALGETGPGAGDPLPFAPALVPHVFNRYRGVMNAALVELDRRYQARAARWKAELGN